MDYWGDAENPVPSLKEEGLNSVLNKNKKLFPLTNNDSRNGKEHKRVSYEESFYIIPFDVPHSLHGQKGLGMHPGSNLLDPTSVPVMVLPVALSHSCCRNLQIRYE